MNQFCWQIKCQRRFVWKLIIYRGHKVHILDSCALCKLKVPICHCRRELNRKNSLFARKPLIPMSKRSMNTKRTLTFCGIEITILTQFRSFCTNAMSWDRIVNMLIVRCALHELQNINAHGVEIRACIMKLAMLVWRSTNALVRASIW